MSGILETGTILDRIVARKKIEVEERRKKPGEKIGTRAPGRFGSALLDKRPGRPVIAEVKHASPSAGVFRETFLPAAIAHAYEQNGARCVSVITDEKFFQGSLDILREVRAATRLPIIRKDFIIDKVQLDDAAIVKADAALLIARILDDKLMASLYDHARSLGLDVLFEVHDKSDLDRVAALSPAPTLIGVNNRDLADFSVSVERTVSLIPHMPEGALVVSESGIEDNAVMDRLIGKGVGAFLIGTALMKSADEGAALRKLVFG